MTRGEAREAYDEVDGKGCPMVLVEFDMRPKPGCQDDRR